MTRGNKRAPGIWEGVGKGAVSPRGRTLPHVYHGTYTLERKTAYEENAIPDPASV